MGVKVRQRNGAWWLFIDHHSQRKAKKVGPGEKGRKLALAAADKIRARLLLEDTGFWKREDPGPTFAEYAARYLNQYAAATLKPSTVEGYRFDFRRHLKPAFGAKRLREITRADVTVASHAARGAMTSGVRDGCPG